MSSERNNYVILGYDLTDYIDSIYDKWSENEENIDRWENNQWEGEIQLFSDPMSGTHLYFGYILSAHNEWDSDVVVKITEKDMKRMKQEVDNKLYETRLGITHVFGDLEYGVICFTEWR